MSPPEAVPSFDGRTHRQALLATVRRLFTQGRAAPLQELFVKIYPADLAGILCAFTAGEALKLFLMIPSPTLAANTLKQLPPALWRHFLREADPVVMGAVIESLPPDARADLLGQLDPPLAERLLAGLDAEAQAEVHQLLRYADASAGALMTPHFFAMAAHATVAKAIAAVRTLPHCEMVFYLYILDDRQQLVGVSSLRQLLLADPGQILREIMNPRVLQVRADAPRAEVAAMIGRYRLLALPVVDAGGVMVGLVTVDDVFDAIGQQAAADVHKSTGASGGADWEARAWGRGLAARLPWLATALIGGIGGCWVLDLVLDRWTAGNELALATFIPVIMGLASQVGILSSTASLRGLSAGASPAGGVGPVLVRELWIGLILGILFGGASGLLAWLFFDTLVVEWIVATTVLINTCLASLLARGLPFLIKRLGRDPALATGRYLHSGLDVLGIVTFFLVASWFLNG